MNEDIDRHSHTSSLLWLRPLAPEEIFCSICCTFLSFWKHQAEEEGEDDYVFLFLTLMSVCVRFKLDWVMKILSGGRHFSLNLTLARLHYVLTWIKSRVSIQLGGGGVWGEIFYLVTIYHLNCAVLIYLCCSAVYSSCFQRNCFHLPAQLLPFSRFSNI